MSTILLSLSWGVLFCEGLLAMEISGMRCSSYSCSPYLFRNKAPPKMPTFFFFFSVRVTAVLLLPITRRARWAIWYVFSPGTRFRALCRIFQSGCTPVAPALTMVCCGEREGPQRDMSCGKNIANKPQQSVARKNEIFSIAAPSRDGWKCVSVGLA